MSNPTITITINYNKNNVNLNINLNKQSLNDDVPNTDVVRYLKGIFTNKARFNERFIKELLNVKIEMTKLLAEGKLEPFEEPNPEDFECQEFMDQILDLYDIVEPYSYEEAFKIENQQFQSMVFGSININEMLSHLGHERIKTDGKLVKHKQFNYEGEFTGYKEYDNIYETHKVDGAKLGIEDDVYAIKCWCTSTNKEHWLWIDEQYKDNPLEAIASTFRIHENLIPHIKELKRQGDILLVEMNKDTIEPEGEIIPLNAEQYFSLLTAQS
jgi:hypothetical protein